MIKPNKMHFLKLSLVLGLALVLPLVLACAGQDTESTDILVRFKVGTSSRTVSEVHRR